MQKVIIPQVSVIVASHREKYIKELIESFDNINKKNISYELIIVADYPVDILQSLFRKVIWIYVQDISISKKRNRGIDAAGGEICAFIDDDCRPQRDWLVNAIDYLYAHKDHAGVEGKTTIIHEKENQSTIREYKRLETRGYRTNNIFYYKKNLIEAGMFDERFTIQREDADLAYTILESGMSIGYQPDICVNHLFRKYEKWDMLKNCINRRFDPLLYSKHKKLYRIHVKSPITPGILLLFFVYCVSFIGLWTDIIPGIYFVSGTGVFVFMMAIRKIGSTLYRNPLQGGREIIALVISPFIILAALVYGSFRFRRFLII